MTISGHAKQVLNANLVPRGVIVLHRHGDRAPSCNIFRSDKDEWQDAEEKEHSKWSKRLEVAQGSPLIKSAGTLRSLDNPNVTFDTSELEQREMQEYPFRLLTTRGARECYSLGAQLRDQYLPFFNAATLKSSKIPRVRVSRRSTEFSRTIQSGLHVWSGMTSQSSHRGLLELDSTCWVSSRNQCSAIAWERSQVLNRIREIAQENFSAQEQSMEQVRLELQRTMPYLSVRPFLWVEAADMFLCSAAHNDPFPFKEFLPLKQRILDHTAWRFSQWYENPSVLRNCCEELVEEVWSTCRTISGTSCLKGVVPLKNSMLDGHNTSFDQFNMVLVAAHDVTLMPLLKLFGMYDTISTEEVGLHQKMWPDYASSIRIEVATEPGSCEPWVCVLWQQSLHGSVRMLPLFRSSKSKAGFIKLRDFETWTRARLELL